MKDGDIIDFKSADHRQSLIGFAGIALLAIGFIYYIFSQTGQGSRVEIIPASESEQNQIIVDISGAVEKPGVYKLASNSRVNEALVVAGGLSLDADREWVSKTINLAAPLKDGIKIYIRSTKDINNDETKNSNSGLINLNTANINQFDSLPGIGPVTAQKIIDYRDQNGSFATKEDLLKVPGVGQKLFDQIKDSMTVW